VARTTTDSFRKAHEQRIAELPSPCGPTAVKRLEWEINDFLLARSHHGSTPTPNRPDAFLHTYRGVVVLTKFGRERLFSAFQDGMLN
jgi:hypothetical protein